MIFLLLFIFVVTLALFAKAHIGKLRQGVASLVPVGSTPSSHQEISPPEATVHRSTSVRGLKDYTEGDGLPLPSLVESSPQRRTEEASINAHPSMTQSTEEASSPARDSGEAHPSQSVTQGSPSKETPPRRHFVWASDIVSATHLHLTPPKAMQKDLWNSKAIESAKKEIAERNVDGSNPKEILIGAAFVAHRLHSQR